MKAPSSSDKPETPHVMTRQDAIIGMSWALAAYLFYSLVPVGIRMLGDRMPAIEIVFFRNAIGLAAFLIIFSWQGWGSLKTERFGLHLQRNFLNFIGMWFWFAALTMMPITKAIALHFTEPLMAAILAMIFLRERPTPNRIIGIVFGFVGILVVLRPGLVDVNLPTLMVLGSALLYASVSIISRVLGRTERASTTTFYYQAMLTVFSIGPAIWVWVNPTWEDVPGLLLVGVVGTVAPYCLIRAIRHAEATVVAPFSFLRLPFTAGWAMVFFSEPTEIWTWVGASIIFGATYFMTRAEHRAVDVATKR